MLTAAGAHFAAAFLRLCVFWRVRLDVTGSVATATPMTHAFTALVDSVLDPTSSILYCLDAAPRDTASLIVALPLVNSALYTVLDTRFYPFVAPQGIAIDSAHGLLYVSDSENYAIVVVPITMPTAIYRLETNVVITFPTRLIYYAGSLLVLANNNNQVYQVTLASPVSTVSAPANLLLVNQPEDLTVDTTLNQLVMVTYGGLYTIPLDWSTAAQQLSVSSISSESESSFGSIEYDPTNHLYYACGDSLSIWTIDPANPSNSVQTYDATGDWNPNSDFVAWGACGSITYSAANNNTFYITGQRLCAE
jgi:hypothetical protein